MVLSLLFLGIGNTMACFQRVGILPEKSDLRIINAMGEAKVNAHFLRKIKGSWSGHELFFLGSLLSISKICESVIWYITLLKVSGGDCGMKTSAVDGEVYTL